MHLRSWQALAVLWCAQTPVVNRAVDTQGNRLGEPFSTCTSYRRPLSRSLEDCLRFCPAIEESCAAAPALAHCEALCREVHPSTYCEVLTISGLQEGATNWPAKVDDLNTRYRMLVRHSRKMRRAMPSWGCTWPCTAPCTLSCTLPCPLPCPLLPHSLLSSQTHSIRLLASLPPHPLSAAPPDAVPAEGGDRRGPAQPVGGIRRQRRRRPRP